MLVQEAKLIGAGLAVSAISGAGTGIGAIFSSVVSSVARKACTLKNQLFRYAILCFALPGAIVRFGLVLSSNFKKHKYLFLGLAILMVLVLFCGEASCAPNPNPAGLYKRLVVLTDKLAAATTAEDFNKYVKLTTNVVNKLEGYLVDSEQGTLVFKQLKDLLQSLENYKIGCMLAEQWCKDLQSTVSRLPSVLPGGGGDLPPISTNNLLILIALAFVATGVVVGGYYLYKWYWPTTVPTVAPESTAVKEVINISSTVPKADNVRDVVFTATTPELPVMEALFSPDFLNLLPTITVFLVILVVSLHSVYVVYFQKVSLKS